MIAATITKNLPLKVVMRDEEIMFPGTFEYAERIYNRPDIEFHWLIARQPIINIFNREKPYFWVFDAALKPDQWVRQPPPFAEFIKDKHIAAMSTVERFPVKKGKDLVQIVGLRTQESRTRNMAIQSANSYISKSINGVRKAYPVYDWTDGDVWKAIADNNWDYNSAYNALFKLKVPKNRLRISPPSMSTAGLIALGAASKAWPQWFDKVCKRLPGVRTAAQFGRKSCEPIRELGESWQDTYMRECINEAPGWIAARATITMNSALKAHGGHSTAEFPQNKGCSRCTTNMDCWKNMVKAMYMGDPFSMKNTSLPYVEPEAFRSGAGTWGGKPTW